MLEHSETLRLIALSQQGDNDAKNKLIEANMPLIKSIIKHYRNRQIEYDDLLQLGAMGLVKAINNFDTQFNVKFSTYAVPMIAGEVKRFIRDDGAIKVSRAIKAMSSKIMAFIEVFKAENEKDPSVEEISKQFGITPQEVIYVMDSGKMPLSLFEKYDDDSQELVEKISNEETQDDVIDKIMLRELIKSLPERERTVIVLRYYRDKTQSEIAQVLGVSQVQVSRIETKIIDRIKKSLIV